ncbi:hypothetical protein M231_01850 [Tremella mesenterica]|uniref:Pali-domain-containing protein n=1 Tax=Tremella mesenterica TaxID=5217 RepID=A0A4Q1BS27_TREME|nr:uncharacterized protein TREMEDRAFT_72679 [Tremella mesenterica DSM 1558]EIW72179.1 hypothetical protein TREMEDRAFT_72679 [Tremella mesenterica DSM 1558]RXK40791.1 hypothetical protein M231_01850 [Tremella mesenterica]
MVSPAFPGLFFAFAGWVLLLFASVSPPAWTAVKFLSANAGSQTTVFGVLGQCVVGGACTAKHVGYNIAVAGASNVNTNPTVLHHLTYALILHPIAGAIAFIGFILGLVGIICASRIATIFMALLESLAAVIALVVFVIDMVLWNLVKNRLRDGGYTATLGNANWLTVGAVVALFLSMCTSVCGACGRFATGRAAGERY